MEVSDAVGRVLLAQKGWSLEPEPDAEPEAPAARERGRRKERA